MSRLDFENLLAAIFYFSTFGLGVGILSFGPLWALGTPPHPAIFPITLGAGALIGAILGLIALRASHD